jgi:hypothetical protein
MKKFRSGLLAASLLIVATDVSAQNAVALRAQAQRQAQRQGAAPVTPGDAEVSPAEIQRMFDGYALMQAEQFLSLSDDQFARFLPRYKALQDLRRQGLQQHSRTVNELRRLVNTTPIDEGQLRDRLKALADLDTTATADVRKAYDAVDQVLDIRQQARFRVFEENMERRKLDLVTRARQPNRPKL